jgi:hypothetical protein
MVYIRHKVPFTLVDLWKLFLSRLKPRCVKKYLRRQTEYWAELTEALVTFKEFAEYLLLNCEINVEHRNDSDINAAYDDTEQEKGYITDENDKLVPIKKTTQLKRPNGGNKSQTAGHIPPWKAKANVQQAGTGSENTSKKKKKKKYANRETMRTAALEPVSEDVALRKFDKSLPHMKRFFDVKDGGLNGACPLGPHEGDPIPWNQCHCLKGKPQRSGGTTQPFHVDVTSMVTGGAGGEIYKAMHKGAKSATCLREIWQNKIHFRVHLLAEREKAMKAKIQALWKLKVLNRVPGYRHSLKQNWPR